MNVGGYLLSWNIVFLFFFSIMVGFGANCIHWCFVCFLWSFHIFLVCFISRYLVHEVPSGEGPLLLLCLVESRRNWWVVFLASVRFVFPLPLALYKSIPKVASPFKVDSAPWAKLYSCTLDPSAHFQAPSFSQHCNPSSPTMETRNWAHTVNSFPSWEWFLPLFCLSFLFRFPGSLKNPLPGWKEELKHMLCMW